MAIERRPLPAQAELLADPQRPGYQIDPTTEHQARSAQALQELASELSCSKGERQPVKIKLHHLQNLFASVLLFGFHLQHITAEGAFDYDRPQENTVHYAVIVNQPVPVQLQSTVDFVSQFLERQSTIERHLSDRSANIRGLLAETNQADLDASARTIDELRFGWRESARRVAERAQSLALDISVEYSPNFLENHHDWKRRVPLLRYAYNQFQDFRSLIDRTVATIVTQRSRVEAPEAIRKHLQQWSTVVSPEKYFAQALRDGLVLGNGYVAFQETEPVGVYALRPERHIPTSTNTAKEITEQTKSHTEVLPFSGFHQPTSQLGIGFAELLLNHLAQHEAIQRAIQEAEQLHTTSAAEARRTVDEYRALAEDHESARRSRVEELLGWWRHHTPSPPERLYFEGQELM